MKHEARKGAADELRRLCDSMEEIVGAELTWQERFDLIFSDEISMRFAGLMDAFGVSFTWCDPDGSYEDDVRAYVAEAQRQGRAALAGQFEAVVET